jgi:DnaK suppressor protein
VNRAFVTKEQISDLQRLINHRVIYLSKLVNTERHRNNATEISVSSPQESDSSIAELETDDLVARVERDTNELAMTQAALIRISNQTYGACIDCGLAIDYHRLLAHPTAQRCLPCQETAETNSV